MDYLTELVWPCKAVIIRYARIIIHIYVVGIESYQYRVECCGMGNPYVGVSSLKIHYCNDRK